MAQLMKLLVTIALTFTITTAIITTITTRTNPTTETVALKDPLKDLTPTRAIKIRRCRFLAEKDNKCQTPKARNQKACNNDSEICSRTGAANSTMACCNNKSVNLSSDNKKCGVCNKRCKYGETCCGGQCVNLSYDKSNCRKCNHCCLPGGYCIYGLCNYAR